MTVGEFPVGQIVRRKALPPIYNMGLILFIAIGLVSCAFFLFVLRQWMRDSQRRPSAHKGADDSSQGLPFVVSSQKNTRSRQKAATRKRGALQDRSSPARGFETELDNSERAVYERIARHVASRNRS